MTLASEALARTCEAARGIRRARNFLVASGVRETSVDHVITSVLQALHLGVGGGSIMDDPQLRVREIAEMCGIEIKKEVER